MNDTMPGYVGVYVVGFLLKPWYQWETLGDDEDMSYSFCSGFPVAYYTL